MPANFVFCRYLDQRITLQECEERQAMRVNAIMTGLKYGKDARKVLCEHCLRGKDPAKTERKKTETEVKAEITRRIRQQFPRIHIFRVFTGKINLGDRWIVGAPPGTPDLCGFLPDGRFLGIEVKKPDGKTSKDRAELQAQFREKCNAAGGLAFQAGSWEECEKILRTALD
jgi:hypothetical protein